MVFHEFRCYCFITAFPVPDSEIPTKTRDEYEGYYNGWKERRGHPTVPNFCLVVFCHKGEEKVFEKVFDSKEKPQWNITRPSKTSKTCTRLRT